MTALPPSVKAQIDGLEISQKSLAELNQEVRDLQKAAQKLKGTPDYDAAQKAYQQKLNDLSKQARPARCCAIFIPRTSSRSR